MRSRLARALIAASCILACGGVAATHAYTPRILAPVGSYFSFGYSTPLHRHHGYDRAPHYRYYGHDRRRYGHGGYKLHPYFPHYRNHYHRAPQFRQYHYGYRSPWFGSQRFGAPGLHFHYHDR